VKSVSATKCLVAAVLLLASGGCFGLMHRIDRATLDRIPNEEKLALFDAENDVIISKDDIEAVEREISDGRVATKRAREKVDLLKDNPEVAGINSPDVMALYTEWANLRLEMREDEMRHLYVKRDLVDKKLWLARAKYELAKAQLVHDHDPERGASVNVDAFKSQVADREKVVADKTAKVAESRAVLEEIINRYDAASQKLQAASGGAYGGPWVD
jgi:hypothetical protein